MIKPGEEWGSPTDATAEHEVRGDDADLAALVEPGAPSPLVRFHPVGSDLAGAVGMAESGPDESSPRGIELPIDAMTTELGIAMNSVVVGTTPARLQAQHRRRPITVIVDGRTVFEGAATTVIVANGQFLDGVDLVPRGHPGDGRLEVQVYALTPGERRPMRRRLPAGNHLPHPRIVCSSGRIIEISGSERAWPVTLDRRLAEARSRLTVTVLPGAIRLLI